MQTIPVIDELCADVDHKLVGGRISAIALMELINNNADGQWSDFVYAIWHGMIEIEHRKPA